MFQAGLQNSLSLFDFSLGNSLGSNKGFNLWLLFLQMNGHKASLLKRIYQLYQRGLTGWLQAALFQLSLQKNSSLGKDTPCCSDTLRAILINTMNSLIVMLSANCLSSRFHTYITWTRKCSEIFYLFLGMESATILQGQRESSMLVNLTLTQGLPTQLASLDLQLLAMTRNRSVPCSFLWFFFFRDMYIYILSMNSTELQMLDSHT